MQISVRAREDVRKRGEEVIVKFVLALLNCVKPTWNCTNLLEVENVLMAYTIYKKLQHTGQCYTHLGKPFFNPKTKNIMYKMFHIAKADKLSV